MNEREAMLRALDLAWRGWGRVHPNPMVGAVVLAGGKVVGKGYHAEFGQRHAEPMALEAAGEMARGETLVVTLEPCAHYGQQPPCTEAILQTGIRRVVVASRDPDPVAQGGAAALRLAGVDVEMGVLAEEAGAQNAIFLHRLANPDRPFVALKLATTLDGRIADLAGRSRWISGPDARDYVHWLRAGFDAIGLGGQTARADNPSLTARGSVQPRVAPTRVIFDRGAELPSTLAVIATAGEVPTLVVTSPQVSTSRVETLEAHGVEVHRAATLDDGLRLLRARELTSLLVEGGGRLAGALLAQGLVDRFYWIQAPLWLGESAAPAVAGLPGLSLGDAERWVVTERRSLGNDTLLVVDRHACLPAS